MKCSELLAPQAVARQWSLVGKDCCAALLKLVRRAAQGQLAAVQGPPCRDCRAGTAAVQKFCAESRDCCVRIVLQGLVCSAGTAAQNPPHRAAVQGLLCKSCCLGARAAAQALLV